MNPFRYRPVNDYAVKVGSGSIFFKPQHGRKKVTATGTDAIAQATLMFGPSVRREAPDSMDLPAWYLVNEDAK